MTAIRQYQLPSQAAIDFNHDAQGAAQRQTGVGALLQRNHSAMNWLWATRRNDCGLLIFIVFVGVTHVIYGENSG